MRSTWLRISEYLRTILLLGFIFPIVSIYFNWFKDSTSFSRETLHDIKNIAILLYIIVYVIELRLKISDKNIEIAKLKTKLLEYEK